MQGTDCGWGGKGVEPEGWGDVEGRERREAEVDGGGVAEGVRGLEGELGVVAQLVG